MTRFTKRRRLVEVKVFAVDETLLALRVSNGTVTRWVPKSLIGDTSEVKHAGDEGLLLIPEFKAKDKGLI